MPNSLLYHLFHDFRMSDERLRRIFEKRNVSVRIRRYTEADRQIRYAATGSPDKPLVIFVHGAPGSLDAFADYLSDPELLQKYHLVSVDRPGFGGSGHGKAVPFIAQQVALLSPLLGLNRSSQLPILVGHSYGGPIIGGLAMVFPNSVGGLLMLAPAVDPDREKVFWISYIARLKLVEALLPNVWKVTNQEKLVHQAELRKMRQGWHDIRHPTTVIQGQRDKIVHPGNALFLRKNIKKAEVNIIAHPRLDHMIPWKAQRLVKKAIRNFFE